MPPARLHHADLVVGEVRQRPAQEVRRRDEIGVEDRDELALRLAQARLERARLESAPVGAMKIRDVESALRLPLHRARRDVAGLIGRVVQHLDFEQVPRIVDLADGVDEPLRHVHLVEDRELDRDARQRIERRDLPLRYVVPVLHVKIHKVVPVPAVDRQNAQDEEIQDENESLDGRHRQEYPSDGKPINRIVPLSCKSMQAA